MARPLKENLEGKVLNAQEMEMLMSSAHKPVKTIAVLAEIANQVRGMKRGVMEVGQLQ